jgi:hypothetical protein
MIVNIGRRFLAALESVTWRARILIVEEASSGFQPRARVRAARKTQFAVHAISANYR